MEIKEEIKDTKKYQTKSLDVAVVIMAKGARITGIKRDEKDSDRKFYTFMFEADFDMDVVAFQHASRTLEMNTADVLDANRRMKSIIHSQPR